MTRSYSQSSGEAIRDKKINNVDTWGIENDLFAFARSGKIKVSDYLAFISEYCLNCDYPTNENLLSHLNWFYFMLYNTRMTNEVKRILAHLCRILIAQLGLERRMKRARIRCCEAS